MFLGLLQLLGLLAAAVTFLTLRGELTDGRQINEAVGGVAATLLWVLFSLGAMDIETVSTSGAVIHDSSPGVAMVGAAFAGLMLIVALIGTTALVDVRDVEPDQYGR